ncbi:MAG TPA: ISAs1 family transposase, partial [Terracidiphilus sp.]|nr:ISAs1 family transposase [Terracidiphilus sp.]
LLNRIALNILRQETTSKRGIKGKRLKAGWDHDYLLKLLGL